MTREHFWQECYLKVFPFHPTDEAAQAADTCLAEFDKRWLTLEESARALKPLTEWVKSGGERK